VLKALSALLRYTRPRSPLFADVTTAWSAEVRSRRADITQAHLVGSFPFRDGELRRRMGKALREHGF